MAGFVATMLVIFFLIALKVISVYRDVKKGPTLKRKKRFINTTEYAEFLTSLNGKNFFLYSNRKNTKEIIDRLFIPKFSPTVELIYLEGKIPISDYDEFFISIMVFRLQNYTKPPHLIKIRNSEVIDASVNNQFYNTIDQGKPIENFINVVHDFFEITEKR